MKAMSPWQFTIFRIVFGGYLLVHFIQLLPHAGELFGASGLLADPALNPSHGLFPNPLDLALPPSLVTGFIALMALLALFFAAGIQRHLAAILLWFGWTALFHRNNLIANPSLAYVGLLLVLSVLVPGGEPWSSARRREPWGMPRWVFRGAWILMAAGYSFSGFTKLGSASWVDGSALQRLLDNPLARPGWVRELMLALPDGLLRAMTWTTLAAELLFVPLAWWSRSRPWIWLAMALMHLGVLTVVDFADLSLGMLMIHLFTFDPAWLEPKGSASRPRVVAFDGDCLMCSRTIRFLAREDRARHLRFTPLQGDYGRTISEQAGADPDQLESMLVSTEQGVCERSTGVIAILEALGGHWRVLAWLGWLVPRPVRDALYGFIARHRSWFGRLGNGDACALPSPELEERLLK